MIKMYNRCKIKFIIYFYNNQNRVPSLLNCNQLRVSLKTNFQVILYNLYITLFTILKYNV